MERLTQITLTTSQAVFIDCGRGVGEPLFVVTDDLAMACQASMVEANVDH
jgi:hypothetical protein